MSDQPVVYIACPYAHSDPAVRQHRFETASRAASKLMQNGVAVFSPLSHSVPIVEIGQLGERGHDFWMACDLPLLQRCDELLVVGMEGWRESRGVIEEMFKAMLWRKPITLISERDIDQLPAVPASAQTFLISQVFKGSKTDG